jgi:hypothetical protein
MSSQLPETTAAPPVVLPAGQMVLEAYWYVARHLRVYAGQILLLAVICWFAQFAASIFAVAATAAASAATQTAVVQLTYIAAVVAVLILGGTAVFMSSQRAIVLGRAPLASDVVKIRRHDAGVLRAVCIYWLIVHLVPTVVVNGGYVAEGLGIGFPRLSTPLSFAFYWGWVLATAPLVVMSLPIALFEGSPAPVTEGRARLNGNTGRLAAASALAFAPLAIFHVALHLVRDAWTAAVAEDPAAVWLIDGVLMSVLRNAGTVAVILVMSALVAAAYLRLSPRLDRVYGVFD